MKLSCAFVLTLTNLVIVSPFSFSVKGSGTSANAGATAVPATFGLVHNVPSKGNGYSGKPSSPGSIGFTSRSENSSFGAFNYNSGQAHGSSEYIAPGEVGHNVATAVQAVVTAAVHANAESLANIKASGSYSPNKINNFSTNSASHFQYQPTTFESKPSSPFNVGQSTSINSHEHSKHVLITSKQSEKSDKFNQPSEVQSLPCQTFNSGSVIAEKSPVYNRGFGGPSGILTPDNKATYIGSSSFSIQQSTTESVKPLIQSLNNEYKKPLDTGVSVKPELKPTASIKPLNNEKTKKDHFVTSSQHGQVSYIKDKNTLSSLGAKVPSTNEYSNEKVPANNFNGSKPIQNFQLFVQPYYGNVLPSSDNNIQNEKAFVSTNNPEKIKQTKEITYTGGFGAPTGVLKPFSQLQSSSHTFVSSEKLEQYETSKTNKVTTTETKESTVTTSSKKPLNEINVNDTPSTESTTYQLHENDSPADSYVTQKLTSPVYDEYSVTSDSPVLSTSKTHSNFFQLEHKEINEASQQPENNTFNPIVTSRVQDPTPSSSFSKVPVSYTIEKQVYVNSLDTKSAVSNSYDKLKPEKTEILISNQNKPVYTPIAATKLTPVSSWEQSSNNIPIKSNFENTQPSKFSVTPKTFQSKYPLESGYTVAKVKQEISGESYSSELNPSTPVSATVVSTLLSGKPQFNDFLLFSTTKPPTASVNGANQYLVTSSAGFSSTSSEYSESHKISSTSDHTLAVINGQSEKAQKIPNNIINDFTYPTASVASLVNSGPIQSVHQSIPNLAISSTNTGTASVQSTLGTIAQQSSYEPLHEYVAPTASSVSKTSENSNVWSSGNALSIDYSSSTQKSNVPNPSASVGSQGNSNPIQNQNQFKPSLPISSINVGTSPLDSTLVAFAQQSSYKPSQEYAAPTAGSIPKVSEIPKVWSMKNSSSIDYSSSTQKPNNFANPTASVAPQGNSNPIQSQNQFKPSLPISSTNVGTSSLDSTLVAFAQQSSYKPSQEYAAPTAGSIPKVSESPKVWLTKNPSSIGYSASTQKPNNFANPTVTFASQTNSNSVQSQHKFNPNLSLSSTNVGSAYVQSTLATFAQQSSYDPSHEYVAPTASSVSKTSENSNVWSSGNALSIDYSSPTQKSNNVPNPFASVGSQGNSNPIQNQNQFKPSLPFSSTNVGTAPLDSALVAFAQQSSYKPSQEYAAPTAGSIPKVSESPKVWSTENPSSIGYSSSTQKPNNFANPTATFGSQINSNFVQSQHKFNPNLSLSSTNVGSAYVQSNFAQQSTYEPSIENSSIDSVVPKVSENIEVFPENPSFIDNNSSTQKPNSLTYSGTSSNSYIKEFELQSSTAPTVGNVTPNEPLYSNTFGTLTGAVKPSGYSHSIVNNLPSSISNSNYDLGLVSVSNVKLGQSNYFSQYKPALSGFKEKSTTLSSLYPTDSIYVSTAKPYVTPASSNIAQQSTELNQEISKFSSSLHSATKPTQGSKQQLNNNGVSTVSLLTPSTIKPTSSYSAVFPTSGPVFVAGSSQSKPQYQYSTVQPATQKKQWYTNTFETFGGVKPQSSYTYPGFTSSFSNFGYGSSIVANKQFTRVPLTGQYKQPSTGQYNPISTGLYKPTSTGQYYPTSTGQYNPTLTNQYKPYNWGFSRQPATLKPSGQIAPAGDLISTADAPKSSTSSEKSKFNYGFSILNQKETGFASGFSSPSVSHTTPKPISSIEEYSGNQKITTFISTTPKTNTQKPWFIASQATTHGATNLLETSDSVTSQFFNGEKPTVAPYSVVPSPNPPSNILPSSEKPVEYFYINNSEPVSDIPKHTSQLSYDKKDNNSFEQISSTTPKIVGLIKPTSSVNFVVQTSSSLSAGSENTKNSQLTTSNYISQQTLNQNNIQIDSSLSTTSSGQETNGPITEFLSNGISSVGYDTSSPKPSSVPFFTNLNFPFTKPSNAPHKSEYTSVSGVSTVVFEPPKKLSESIVPNYSSAVSTENNYSIISDKEEVKDQVTSISGFQHNPLVFSNSFNSVIPSKPSAKPGQNISSKPQDQSILSPKDSLLAENQGKLDINVKPTNLHSSSTIQLSGSIYNSSNQQKPTATVSLPAQSEDTRTVYQKPLSQHSSLFHSGTTQLSKPNIKITVINPPSSSAVYSQYVGSFGGPSGLLKPNDFSGPFVQANVPSQKNLSHQNQPALDINSGIKVAEHSKLGSYSGGFGGPPGVLKPDNSEIHTGVFYAGQDKQSLNLETSGLHGSLTIHNLSPSAPSVGSYADIKKQNVYSPFIPTKPNKAISPNSEGLANSKVESYNQQHSGVVHDSGNTKSTSSFSGQFGKVNSLSTIATVEASAEAGTGPFGLKGAFTSGLASAHSSGPIANTDHGSKIF